MADEPHSKKPRLDDESSPQIEEVHMEDVDLLSDDLFVEQPSVPLGNTERLSNYLAFHPDINKISDALKVLHSKLKDGSNDIGQHVQVVPNLALPEDGPKKLLVGLIGEAGVGKSTLTNLVIDAPKCAETGASGNSISCVPVLYQSRLPNQTSEFAAKIYFKGEQDVKDIIDELVEAHEKLATARANPKQHGSEDMVELKKDQKMAVRTIKGLLKGHKNSIDQEDVGSRLSEDSASFKEDWLEACMEIIAQPTTDSDYHEAGNGADLNKSIAQYTLEVPTNLATLWPLVHHVDVGVRHRHILDYVTIVDLPGENDNHFIRAKVASTMQKDCDCIWLVARIDRAIDDQEVQRRMRQLLTQPFRAVALVCTRNEVQDVVETVTGLYRQGRCDERLGKYADTAQFLARTAQNYRSQNNSQAASQTDAGRKRRALLDQVEPALNIIKEDLRQKCMSGAAENVQVQIIAGLKGETCNTAEFRVFATSAETYKEATNAGDWQATASGIPSLRAFLLDLAAETMESTLKSSISALQNHLDYIKTLTHTGQGAVIRQHQQLFESLSELSISKVSDWSDEVKAIPLEEIKSAYEQASRGLPRTFSEISENWQEIHHSTYAKICRMEGIMKRKTKGTNPQDWPHDLTKDLTDLTKPRWQHTRAVTKEAIVGQQKLVVDALEKRARQVQGIEGLAHKAADDVSGFFRSQARKARDVFAKCNADVDVMLRQMEADMAASSSDSYATQFLRPAFKRCGSEAGRGMKARMHEVMLHYLGARPPKDLVSFMVERCAEQLGAAQELCIAKVTDFADRLDRQLATTYQSLESEGNGPDAQAASKALLSMGSELETGLQGVRASLSEITADRAAQSSPGVMRWARTTVQSSQE